MMNRGFRPFACLGLVPAYLLCLGLAGCGGDTPNGPAGPDSQVAKAGNAEQEARLKLQEEQKAKKGR